MIKLTPTLIYALVYYINIYKYFTDLCAVARKTLVHYTSHNKETRFTLGDTVLSRLRFVHKKLRVMKFVSLIMLMKVEEDILEKSLFSCYLMI